MASHSENGSDKLRYEPYEAVRAMVEHYMLNLPSPTPIQAEAQNASAFCMGMAAALTVPEYCRQLIDMIYQEDSMDEDDRLGELLFHKWAKEFPLKGET